MGIRVAVGWTDLLGDLGGRMLLLGGQRSYTQMLWIVGLKTRAAYPPDIQ